MFRTGQVIPESGIYGVVHAAHQLPKEVTLIRGQQFPRCCRCAHDVTFAPIHLAPTLDALESKIVLYELPEMDWNDLPQPDA